MGIPALVFSELPISFLFLLALENLIPPYYPTEIDFQNLVAVLECISKSLLPKQYRDVERSEWIRAD